LGAVAALGAAAAESSADRDFPAPRDAGGHWATVAHSRHGLQSCAIGAEGSVACGSPQLDEAQCRALGCCYSSSSSPARPRCFRSKLLEAIDVTDELSHRHAAQQSSSSQRPAEQVPVTWERSADERQSCAATHLSWRTCGGASDSGETCRARGCCWVAKSDSRIVACYSPAWRSSFRGSASATESTDKVQARISTGSVGTLGSTTANPRSDAQDGTSSELSAFGSLVAEVRDVWRSVSSATSDSGAVANDRVDVAGEERQSERKHASRYTVVLIVVTSLAALMVLSTVCMSCFFRSSPLEHESGEDMTPRFDFGCCTLVSRQNLYADNSPIQEESFRQNYTHGFLNQEETSVLDASICSFSPRGTRSSRDVRACSAVRRDASPRLISLQVVDEPKYEFVPPQVQRPIQRTRCSRLDPRSEQYKELVEMFDMRWDTTLWLAADGVCLRSPLVREIWNLEADDQRAAFEAKASELEKLPGHKHGYTVGNEKKRFHGARMKCQFNGFPCGEPTCGVCRVIQLGHFTSNGLGGELVFTAWSHTAKGYGLAPGKEPPPTNLDDFVAPGAGNAIFVASVLLGTPEVVKWKTTGPLPPGRQSRVADKSASVDELVIFDPVQALPLALLLFA